MNHQCPGPGCDAKVPQHMLMCRPHWYQVPKVLRDNVWREFQAEPGSQDHKDACHAAIRSITPEAAA